GVGDAERHRQQALLLDPDGAGHLPVAVEHVEPGGHRPGPDVRPPWPDRGHAGAGDRRRVVDNGRVADAHPGHVGDGVHRTGRELTGMEAEIPQPRPRPAGYPPLVRRLPRTWRARPGSPTGLARPVRRAWQTPA